MLKRVKKDKDSLGTEKISALFWSYCIPAIVATTASSIYNIIDRIFIGNWVGAMAISGLALTFPIMNLAAAFGTLVGAGASARVSILLGEGRSEEATRTLGNSLIMNIIIGIAFSIIGLIFLDPILYIFGASKETIPYARDFMQIILGGNVITHIFFGLNNIMRASGYPTKAMISTLLTVTINVILAPLFIYNFRWGIRGAALATVLAQTVGMIWVLAHFMHKKSIVHFLSGCFKLSRRILADIFSIGMSPFLIHVAACLVTIVMNWQLGKFGGDLVIGAFGIINSVIGLILMIVFGFAQGMQPIVGYNWGAKQISRVVKTFMMTLLFASFITSLGFLVAMLAPRQIAHAFNNDESLIELTANGMRLYMLAFPIVGFQMVTSYFFQSIGKARISIWLSLSRQVLCLIPLLFLLPLFWKLNGVWLASAASDLISSIITGGVLLHFYLKLKKQALT
ncbi:MAG: MATE family efflux transporter [Bacteroidales bacterium]|jgi:putative MATE family efflux protein|nr:MATE family efflux transporter [Bacteroidales bacterium]